MDETKTGHEDAVETFRSRVAAADVPVQKLILFGSVARTTHTPESDVDVLAVLDDDVDVSVVEEQLRDIAYDVMLEHGTVFSIHAVTESTLEGRENHPFFRNVLAEGEPIYG